MKQQIHEIKRMQQLAGVATKAINEGIDTRMLVKTVRDAINAGSDVEADGELVTQIIPMNGTLVTASGIKMNIQDVGSLKIDGQDVDMPQVAPRQKSTYVPEPVAQSDLVYPPGSRMDEVVNKALKTYRSKNK